MRWIIVLSLTYCSLDSYALQGGETVKIGGIMQWIQYEGPDTHAPLLLFLHGGPGNSMISYADKFTEELKQHFIVVFWDQRQSGKTATINSSNESLTVSMFVQDAIEVILFLRKKFNKDKIHMLGHSWGGFLGLRVAAERPDLLVRYFAMSPMIDQLKSERIALHKMLEKAEMDNDHEAFMELREVKIPFENGVQLYFHRKWLSKFQGSKTPNRVMVEMWAKTWLTIYNEACTTDLIKLAPKLDCPVSFLVGSYDYQTYYSLTEEYYNNLVCPDKHLIWFTHSSHSPNLTETKKFERTIIDEMTR